MADLHSKIFGVAAPLPGPIGSSNLPLTLTEQNVMRFKPGCFDTFFSIIFQIVRFHLRHKLKPILQLVQFSAKVSLKKDYSLFTGNLVEKTYRIR